jgi:hypothetical protein
MNYLKHFAKLRSKGFKPKIDLDLDVKGPKELGARIKVSLTLDDIGTNTAIGFLSDKLLKKTEIENKISELVVELVDSFDIGFSLKKDKSKVANIETKRKEPQNENEKILKSELTDEDMNKWTTKSSIFYAADVTKLQELKSKLRLKTNSELMPYVHEFFDDNSKSVGDILPKNIEDFNDFLQGKIDLEAGGKAV